MLRERERKRERGRRRREKKISFIEKVLRKCYGETEKTILKRRKPHRSSPDREESENRP